ncbi:MAG: DEAD/DEAH box helicase [Elusimicrobia bacterium]|jgi:ATP-dependent RNA helicase DeaD|nr:DEAD/DEAH box helicase [Elusimicrobiota bacterium]
MDKLKFTELNLSPEILKAVADMGFEETTPIQSLAIPKMIEGVDLIGQAQTGTGKTAAFGIPILEKIVPKEKKVQALIMCPTRELAIQVAEELKSLSKYKKGINIVPVYGGQPIVRQMSALHKGAHIVIGTPGRIIDHIERQTIKLDNTKVVVLDEADEMLDMGFRDDIELILKNLPQDKQTVFFSATMPREFLVLTKKYQKNPVNIKVVHEKLTVPQTEQLYCEVREHQKVEALARCIDMADAKLSLVFCNTKKRVDEVTAQLQIRGYSADAIHGDMNQTQRDRVMDKFRNCKIEILVATDVAARGIDVDDVEAVFNFDIPQDIESYVHRIGRTGRAGRAGKAYSFVAGKDIYKIRDIQRYTKVTIKRMPVPSLADVENVRISSFMEKLKETLKKNTFEKYITKIESLITDNITSVDVAAALFEMMLQVENPEKHEDIDMSVSSFERDFSRDRDSKKKFSKSKKNRHGAAKEYGMTRLFMSIGKSKKVRPGDFVGAIAGETGLSGDIVGSIDIFDKFSFVEVPNEYAQQIIDALNNSNIKGHKVAVEKAQGK